MNSNHIGPIFSALFFVFVAIASGLYHEQRLHSTIHNQTSRGPSSVIYDENGYEVYANDSIADLEERRIDGRALDRFAGQRSLFLRVSQPEDDYGQMRIEASRRTGLSVKRAQRVKFVYEALKPSRRGDRILKIPLFADFAPAIEFLPSHIGKANHQVYVGSIVGDIGSRVELFATHGGVSGTVRTSGGREFRIVDAGGGQQYVIEVQSR
jgi:hypothetical protein